MTRLGQDVDQTQLVGAYGGQVVTGERQLHGDRVRNALRQPQQPPPPATRPRLTSGMPNAESRAATIRSVASASSVPPANA
ncbi:hypothetical protein BZL30_6844 [Mycobacterium kansasii]|uniref:Uncharacterized protein n=1 Tax=Mycobacterium kansasii TaxID=1768 RepID=A0A1V3WQF2_MYCKA|nr:hypothetical protein BZL30_6844 [Mycobacterium kansasii]